MAGKKRINLPDVGHVSHLVTVRATVISKGKRGIILEDGEGAQTELRDGFYPPSVEEGEELEWVISGTRV